MPNAIAPTPHQIIPIEAVQPTATTEIGGVKAFRVGTWVDGWGEQRTWSVEELQEACSAYNESASSGQRRAPVLLNHESYSGDRGWIRPTARVENDAIVLDLEQVDLEFAADLKAGRWTYRSIGFWNPDNPYNPTPGRWNIAELSFTPLPAVDGLGTVFSWAKSHAPKFSTRTKQDSLKLTFGRSPLFSTPKNINSDAPKFRYWGMGMEAIAQLLQRQRDEQLATSGDVAATNEMYPEWAIASIREMAMQSFMTADDMELLLSEISGLYDMIGRLEDRIIEGQMKDLEQAQPSRGYMADTNTEHDARFSAIAQENETLKAANAELNGKVETLSTVVEQLQQQAAAAEFRAEEAGVRAEVEAIAREQGLDGTAEFSAFVEKHTRFAMVQPKTTEGSAFSIGDKAVSAREFYLTELSDRKPQRQYSAGRIDIDPSDRPFGTASITSKRKTRTLPKFSG